MYVWTDTITRNNEPLFKLVLWFVLGRGSKVKIVFATSGTVSQAEGIIDDTSLLIFAFSLVVKFDSKSNLTAFTPSLIAF